MAFLMRCTALLAALLYALPAAAQGLQLHEPEIKAGLLYNFLKYTDWPQMSDGMTLCVFGGDPFKGYLKPMEGRTVNRRVIAVRYISDASEAAECHLLFLNADKKERWPELRGALAGKSILTVSDFSPFAASGGMIEFSHKDNHISANLNIDAVNAAGLRVEDRLLKLVTVVHGGRP